MGNMFRVNPRLTLEIEAKTQKDLWWALSEATECFGDESCGRCGCEDTRFTVRKVIKEKEEFEYPEKKCMNPDCEATLNFHLNLKGGGMYPGRKLEDGKTWDYAHRGWKNYFKDKEKNGGQKTTKKKSD